MQNKYYFDKGLYERKNLFFDIRLYLIFSSSNFSNRERDLKKLKSSIDKLVLLNSHNKRLLRLYANVLNNKIFSLRRL